MRFLDTLKEEIDNSKKVVIPDIKCYSPKDGDLLMGRDPVEVAVGLVHAGAKVCSVVTEEKEFKGSMELLRKVCQATKVPVLRKDFIHTREDLIETKEAGASAILLMCSCLEKDEMIYLYEEALKLGIDPFVETHNREEMEFAISLGAKIIGINNRNILELEKDDGTVSTTCDIIKYAPDNTVIISESSMMNSNDVNMAFKAGANVALVGTAIWKAKDPYLFYKSLIRDTSIKICGLMREEDVDLCMRYGVDILGFVCEYPKYVPWNMDRDRVKELVARVEKTHRTCIITGGAPENTIELAKYIRPSMVQPHCEETAEDIRVIVEELHKDSIKVIKYIPVNMETRLKAFGTTDTKSIVKIMCDTKLDCILLDARDASKPEQTGVEVDMGEFLEIKQILEEYTNPPELIIAGGITPLNIEEYITKTKPTCVDILSGVEASTGVKSEDKINRILEVLNR